MATSQVAMNKVFNARSEGRSIPEGWGVTEAGEATTDPNAAVFGVPLGGYKGYGLALMVEVLCGVLAGAGVREGVGNCTAVARSARTPATSTSRSTPSARSAATRSRACSAGCSPSCARSRRARGFDEVLVAGDPEDRARAARERSGIPIEPVLWEQLCALSDELGVSLPAGT